MFARVIILTAGLAVLVPARPVLANGAFPESDAVLLPVDRPQQIGLATNFGLIISDDGGTSWQWTCERAETSMATAYARGAAPADRLFSLSLDVGLAFSDDDSCSWRRAGGALATAIATDYFPDPTDAAHVLAIVGPQADGGLGAAAVYESNDGGDSFAAAPLFVAGAGDELLGVEIARADPRVIYLAIAGPGPHPMLARSADAGATWTMRDIEPSLGARRPRIIAVDPVDPDVIYLRVLGAGVELLAVSRDGGVSFATPITLTGGTLTAFARLANGTVLVAGLLPGDGGLTTSGVAWRSGDGGVTFGAWALDPVPRLRALGERDGTLFLAGDNYMDGWALAVSSDEGRTIQPIARYDQVSAVKACVAAVCQELCDEQAGRKILGARGVQPTARRRRGRRPAGGLGRLWMRRGPAARRSRDRRAAGRPRYGAAKCGETATPRSWVFVAVVATAVPTGVPVPVSTNTTRRLGVVWSASNVVAINVTVCADGVAGDTPVAGRPGGEVQDRDPAPGRAVERPLVHAGHEGRAVAPVRDVRRVNCRRSPRRDRTARTPAGSRSERRSACPAAASRSGPRAVGVPKPIENTLANELAFDEPYS